MSISVVCPNCSAKLTAHDSAGGKKVKCPQCQTVTAVPQLLPEEPAFEVVDEPQPAPAPPPATPPVKAKAKVDVFLADDKQEDEKPKKPVKAPKSSDDDYE